MLFMMIGTCEPERRAELVKRGAEKGPMTPDGMNVIGQWGALATGKVFGVVETDDPMKLFQLSDAWSDIIKMEIIPVIAKSLF
jgi:hypothetical protein